MSQKQDKKIRQLFRRKYATTAEELAANQVNMIKPKPKWVPMAVWLRLLGIFVRIRTSK